MPDATGNVCLEAILGLDISSILRDSIIDGIDCLNKFFVHLEPKKLNFVVTDLCLESIRDDLLSKMSDIHVREQLIARDRPMAHLYTRPAEESLVANPFPKISSKPRWW